MVTEVTDGISVSVETFYQVPKPHSAQSDHLFAYRITIENLSAVPIQLLRRHWYIKDSDGSSREVEGEGVVGQQPIIAAGESYQYVSAVNLNGELGKMFGIYNMENLYNKQPFVVNIPEFLMVAPFKLN